MQIYLLFLRSNNIITFQNRYLGHSSKGDINYGKQFKKQKEALLAANNTKKSKGERLGWKSISEYKTVSLKEIVGNGNRVNETNIPVNTSIRLVP